MNIYPMTFVLSLVLKLFPCVLESPVKLPHQNITWRELGQILGHLRWRFSVAHYYQAQLMLVAVGLGILQHLAEKMRDVDGRRDDSYATEILRELGAVMGQTRQAGHANASSVQ